MSEETKKYTDIDIIIALELERIFKENHNQLCKYEPFITYEGLVDLVAEIGRKYREDKQSKNLRNLENVYVQSYVVRYIDKNFLNKELWKEQIELLTDIKNKLKKFNELDGAKIDLNFLITEIEDTIEECETESKEN